MIGKNCPVVQNLHENKVKRERMKIGFKPNSIPKISAVIQHYNILKKNLNYGPNHVSVNIVGHLDQQTSERMIFTFLNIHIVRPLKVQG